MSRQLKQKEAVILLIDVGQNVSQQSQDGTSFLFKSKQCASRVIQRKIFSDAKDEFGIILIGSEKSNNELEYSNINVKYERLSMPNWNMVKDIENLSPTNVTADWLDGLIAGINLLKNETEIKKFTNLKILLISNLATSLQSTDQVDDVIEAMKELKISLVVIGPEVEDDDNDMEDLSLTSKTQKKGEAIVGRIIDETEGIICGFAEAMSQLDHFQKFTGRAQPWYCDLEIGKSVFIPIAGFKKFATKPLLKWGKRSVENSRVTQETVYFQGDSQIEKSDAINSYLFGQTVVPISGDDKSSMSLGTEKCFQLIGFTKKQNVPRHILLGDSVHYITPRNGFKSSEDAVTALVKALLDLEMVGIVRKVYCRGSTPHLGALIPICEQKSCFFYYAELPFAEDERFLRLPSLGRVQTNQEQLDAVDKFIDAMDLSQYDEDEDPYRKFVNPSVEHVNNMIALKALNPDATLPKETSEYIKSLIQPKSEILENASNALDSIKKLFPLEELEQKNYRRGAAEVFDRTTGNGTSDAEYVKPLNLIDSMASFVQSTVTEIGTVDPENNFLKLLECGEPFGKLCEQMQAAITKLLLTSNSAVGIQKPLSALVLLRKHCISKNPIIYNAFAASLKDELAERNNEFWNFIVQEKLGLITSEETKESGVSAEDAEIFYSMKKYDSQNEGNYEMEAEDLLDMI